MNSIKIHLMLSVKNIYALLFVCVTHLGCTSSYLDRMHQGGDTSFPSSSKEVGISGAAQGGTNEELNARVKKFLDKKDFEQGSPVNDGEINAVIKELGRNIDMFDINSVDKDYKAFLNKYGSIDGGGFDIYGPTEYTGNSEKKIQHMASIQRGFERSCKMNEMKASKIKSCWLIAGIDQGDEYYINLSGENKKNIYSMSPDGKSKLFAKDFLEFLDKFFEAYERKSEEEAYEEEAYEEQYSD